MGTVSGASGSDRAHRVAVYAPRLPRAARRRPSASIEDGAAPPDEARVRQANTAILKLAAAEDGTRVCRTRRREAAGGEREGPPQS